MTRRIIGLCAGVALGLTAVVRASPTWPPLGLDLYRPVPQDNQLTSAKIALGRQLFFDPRLSRDGSRSCASCHDPAAAFAGRLVVGVGVGGARGTRNVPALVNRAWGATFFWDGRAASLEEQVLQPILNQVELGATSSQAVALIRSPGYAPRFIGAFGREPVLEDLARALASYVRTILSGDAPIDRYRAGHRSAIEPAAERGLGLFGGRAGCSVCHAGSLFTDEQFHNTGVAWRMGTFADPGRSRVTGAAADRGAFRTPTLREVARTAPYMHDGTLHTLRDVIDFYDRGGVPNPELDVQIQPLGLTSREKDDLVAFLGTLTGVVSEGR